MDTRWGPYSAAAYVSLGAARDVYGVVLDAETVAIDAAATQKRRAAIRASAK
jgi:hypothetical protein